MKSNEWLILAGVGAVGAYLVLPGVKSKVDNTIKDTTGGGTGLDLSNLLGGVSLGGSGGGMDIGGLLGGVFSGFGSLTTGLTSALGGIGTDPLGGLTGIFDNLFNGLNTTIDKLTGSGGSATPATPAADGVTPSWGQNVQLAGQGISDAGKSLLSLAIGGGATYLGMKVLTPAAGPVGKLLGGTVNVVKQPFLNATESAANFTGKGVIAGIDALGAPAGFTIPTVMASAAAFAGGYGLGTVFNKTSWGQAVIDKSGRLGANTAVAVNNGTANPFQSLIGNLAGWKVAQPTVMAQLLTDPNFHQIAPGATPNNPIATVTGNLGGRAAGPAYNGVNPVIIRGPNVGPAVPGSYNPPPDDSPSARIAGKRGGMLWE